MKVHLVDHMGSDNSVVDAARVSFEKLSTNYTDHENARLITYLAYNGHWSPFTHQFITFRIKAPVFVARQLAKHQVGFAWNEVSRRYVDSEPEFYLSDYWRKKAENVKQGSSDDSVPLFPIVDMETDTGCVHLPSELYGAAKETYLALLKLGVCPEQARMVLPQAMMTEWIWSGSLYAWSRMCNLRLDKHTQRETKEVAVAISKLIEPLFPLSWKVLTNGPE